MATCYVGLGANSGDRAGNIKEAISRINSLPGTKVLKRSRIRESKPQGGPKGQPDFLNGALKIRTRLSPAALLKEFKRIEQDLGRPKKHKRFDIRAIDLDILIYGDRIINTKNLTVPHPRMFEREFVLEPLREVIS